MFYCIGKALLRLRSASLIAFCIVSNSCELAYLDKNIGVEHLTKGCFLTLLLD